MTTPEIYVQFKRGKGKVKIKIHKNKTLLKERIKNNYKNKLMFKNVIIMFFDTIS